MKCIQPSLRHLNSLNGYHGHNAPTLPDSNCAVYNNYGETCMSWKGMMVFHFVFSLSYLPFWQAQKMRPWLIPFALITGPKGPNWRPKNGRRVFPVEWWYGMGIKPNVDITVVSSTEIGTASGKRRNQPIKFARHSDETPRSKWKESWRCNVSFSLLELALFSSWRNALSRVVCLFTWAFSRWFYLQFPLYWVPSLAMKERCTWP